MPAGKLVEHQAGLGGVIDVAIGRRGDDPTVRRVQANVRRPPAGGPGEDGAAVCDTRPIRATR